MAAFLDASAEEISAFLAERDFKVSRLKPLYDVIFRRRALDWSEMEDVPVKLREALAGAYSLHPLRLKRKDVSHLDGTIRYFFQTQDNRTVSTVYLPEPGRVTLCLSSQVGCAYACQFCASGLVKFERQLTAAEILDQILLIAADQKSSPTNLLFMGMGEPLANYEQVTQSLRWMTAVQGLNIGPSRISLSTSGLVPQIKKLADDGFRIRLAISLHAVRDALRKEIMPVSSHYKVEELIEAARYFRARTKWPVMFEYILLSGVNDTTADADELGALMKGFDSRVNLIPYNPVAGLPYERPTPARIKDFQSRLRLQGVGGYTRKPKGLDIGSACGQLGAAR